MKIIKPNIPTILALIALLFTFSCSKSDSGGGYNTNPPPPPATNTVNINGMSFSPSSKAVKVGVTVTWVNNDVVAHTVTADDNSFDSGSIAAGGKFTHTFAAAGTYAYHCNFHAMSGSVVVSN